MRLPDFSDSVEFLRLRRLMNAGEVVTLGTNTWKPLPPRGIDVEDINDVVALPDGTLSYEGHRVLVYIRDQYVEPDGSLRNYKYHFAECSTLDGMRRKKRFGRYVATDRKDGIFIVNLFNFGDNKPLETEKEVDLGVCRNCLRNIDWEGYQTRARNQKARDQIFKTFSPSKYFQDYDTQISTLPSDTEFTAPLNTYDQNWPDTSKLVRTTAEWKCQKCGVDLSRHKNLLHVHHIDGNKGNIEISNLRPLCVICHAKEPDHGHLKYSPEYLKLERLIDNRQI